MRTPDGFASLGKPLQPTNMHASPLGTSPLFPRVKLSASPDAFLTAVGEDDHDERSTNLQTCFNMVNTYIGSKELESNAPHSTCAAPDIRMSICSPVVLLSQPFCFAQSGWLAMPTLAALTAFGGFTGMLVGASAVSSLTIKLNCHLQLVCAHLRLYRQIASSLKARLPLGLTGTKATLTRHSRQTINISAHPVFHTLC